MTDGRTFIRVHDGLPDHPKIFALSDRAFRLLIESWCWCSRHLTDGFIPGAAWRKRGTARARVELLAAGLAEEVEGGVWMHNYLQHQRSAAEVEQARQARNARGESGSYGNHVRWHVREGIVRPGCPHCPSPPARSRTGHFAPKTNPDPPPGVTEKRPVDKTGDKPVDTATTCDASHEEGSTGAAGPIAHAIANGSQTVARGRDRDIDTGPTVPISGGAVDHHPSGRYARTRASRDESSEPGRQLDEAAAAVLKELTGRTITGDQATAIRRRVLDGRTVSNPRAYLVKALRADPAAFLPPARDPADQSLTEALARDRCPHEAASADACALCRRTASPPSGGGKPPHGGHR